MATEAKLHQDDEQDVPDRASPRKDRPQRREAARPGAAKARLERELRAAMDQLELGAPMEQSGLSVSAGGAKAEQASGVLRRLGVDTSASGCGPGPSACRLPPPPDFFRARQGAKTHTERMQRLRGAVEGMRVQRRLAAMPRAPAEEAEGEEGEEDSDSARCRGWCRCLCCGCGCTRGRCGERNYRRRR